jgi:hypothetical protein
MTPMVNDNLPRSDAKLIPDLFPGGHSQDRPVVRLSIGEDIKRRVEGFNVSIREMSKGEEIYNYEKQRKNSNNNSYLYQEKINFSHQDDIRLVSNNFCKSKANAGDISVLQISRDTVQDNNNGNETCETGVNRKRQSETDNSISVFLATGARREMEKAPSDGRNTEVKPR